MAALQGLRFIGIGTHDSIGIGEDGPTHQTIGYVCVAPFFVSHLILSCQVEFSLPSFAQLQPYPACRCRRNQLVLQF